MSQNIEKEHQVETAVEVLRHARELTTAGDGEAWGQT